MKHIKTFESFLNEASGLSYWGDYAKDTSGQAPAWMSKEAKSTSEVVKLVDQSIEYWNNEADADNKVPKGSEKRISDLAMQYFKQFKSINGNIISAMIAQES
jgi:hypothetical protein